MHTIQVMETIAPTSFYKEGMHYAVPFEQVFMSVSFASYKFLKERESLYTTILVKVDLFDISCMDESKI